MTLDLTADQDATKTRLETLAGGRVHDPVPEETALAKDSDGFVRPYMILTFSSPYPKEADRTIEGEEQQPHVMTAVVECWGPTYDDARRLANAVVALMIGWMPPGDNCSEYRSRSGNSFFDQRDTGGRPVRFMIPITLLTDVNQSVATI